MRVKYIIIPGGNDGCGTRARLEDDGKNDGESEREGQDHIKLGAEFEVQVIPT